MGEAVAFYVAAALILGFAVLVITARSTVHSVIFLVLNFLSVAGLYVLLSAQFLAVIQVLVYAGGIVVLYLFVVMLVNLKHTAEAYSDPRRLGRLGVVLSLAVLAELVAIAAYGWSKPETTGVLQANNVEQLGWALYTDYLIPFEVASMLLLVAMIGAIVLAKREL
ncbi:MAG: NADH-quinone oxidoreductase subunit J [Vicinamibacterales bacterium]|nr:NADH-quinone oxidoreductase subunit J [Vicinamibacterales bacterium]